MSRELVNSKVDNFIEISLPVARGEFDSGVKFVIGDFEETVKRAMYASQFLAIGDILYGLQAHARVLQKRSKS